MTPIPTQTSVPTLQTALNARGFDTGTPDGYPALVLLQRLR